MNLKQFKQDLDDEVQAILDSSLTVEVTETETVPNDTDPYITYPNLDENTLKCKLIKTCVLYVDLRRSTTISFSHQPKTLSKLYSAFIRSMIRCGRHYGGHVRGIIGDRVMVVFNSTRCFVNAVDTAILMNSVVQHVLNKRFKANQIQAGIGIDFGNLLVTKTGIIRRGAESHLYRSLVWLGRPANIASKLTDVAAKKVISRKDIVQEGKHYPAVNTFHWNETDPTSFLSRLQNTNTRNLVHEDQYFFAFLVRSETKEMERPSILMTKTVYDGLIKEASDRNYIKAKLFKMQFRKVSFTDERIYGGDVTFTDIR